MFLLDLVTYDGDTVELASSEDDFSDIVAEIAESAAVFLTDTATELRSQIADAALDIGLEFELLDYTVAPFKIVTHLRVRGDDCDYEYGLHSCGIGEADPGRFRTEFKGGAAVPRDYHGRWCKGAGCQGGGSFAVSRAQGDVARDELADQIAAAGDDLEARAAVLSSISSFGDYTTGAEHDRLPNGRYKADREKIHDEIIDDYFAQRSGVPQDGKAIIAGGLPGSGKSTALKSPELGINENEYIHIDPDEIKQTLLDRDLVPRVKGMTAGEHASLLHEESGHIADRIFDRAVAEHRNVILDKTMSKPAGPDVTALRAAGYGSVRGVFVDVPVDESHFSAKQRWLDGGRFIPPSYIEESRVPGTSDSKNLIAFRSSAPLFDDWMVMDNTGIGTPERNPRKTVRQGAGAATFAQNRLVVFRSAVPRDYHGQWCRGSQCSDPGLAGAHADTIVGGGKVEIPPGLAVATIENLGQRPEPSDLTLLTIEGHPDLFGAVGENQLRRVDMPQIPTAKLDGFGDYLHQRGVTTRIVKRDPADLRATQNELDGRKVGQMTTAMRTGTMVGAEHPLWVSSDSRILDGHHRWAAEAAMSVGEEKRAITTVEASVPMTTLIGLAREYSNGEGIQAKRHGMAISRRVAQFKGTGDVPRDYHGRWTRPGGAMPTGAEFDQMEKIGGPLGSNGGQWYRDDSGQKYLVKPAPSKQHAHNELAAGLTYEHLGVPVNQTGVFEQNGQWYVSKRAVDGDTIGMHPTPDIQSQAQHGFPADALTSSWDTFGASGDNTLIGSDGTVYRIDVGGSNMFRAQGGDKPSFNPGSKWVEVDTMRTGRQGKSLYGDFSNKQAAEQLGRLQQMDLAALDQRFATAGIDAGVRQRTIATYSDRINNQLPGILTRLRGGSQ